METADHDAYFSHLQLMEQTLVLNELQSQLEESRLLLEANASMKDDMEKQLTELEERLESAPSKEEFDAAKKQRDELEANLVEVKQQVVKYEREKSGLLLEVGQLKERIAAASASGGGERDEDGGARAAAEADLKEQEVRALKEELAGLRKASAEQKEAAGELERRVKKAECERERAERELNDELEQAKESKRRLKATAEETAREVVAKETEIAKLEREVKSLIQVVLRIPIRLDLPSLGLVTVKKLSVNCLRHSFRLIN